MKFLLAALLEFAARRLLTRGLDGEAEVANRIARARKRVAAAARVRAAKHPPAPPPAPEA